MRAQPLLQTEVVSPEPSFPGSGVCACMCVCARACELCVGMCVRACVSCVCVWVCVRAHSFNELASEMSLQRSRVGGTEQARGFRVCPV